MTWIDQAIDEYIKFLKKKIQCTPADNGWYTITTPFLNMFNDCIDIFCKNDNGSIILSDDGETLGNLELLGISFSRKSKQKDILSQILLNYGVERQDKDLLIKTSLKDFPKAKHNLLSAIMAISDIYITAKGGTIASFTNDVQAYLDEQEIISTPGFITRGYDNLDYHFDFQIAGKTKEILIKTFNTVNNSNLKIFLYDWDGIKDIRQEIAKKNVLGLAIINDEEKEVSPNYLDALQHKGAEYVLWSSRYIPENINKFKAAG